MHHPANNATLAREEIVILQIERPLVSMERYHEA
jgi:hypothetical protein